MFEIKKQTNPIVKRQIKNVYHSNDFQAVWNIISLYKWNSIVKFWHQHENWESFWIIQSFVPYKIEDARNKVGHITTSPKNAFNQAIVNKIALIP